MRLYNLTNFLMNIKISLRQITFITVKRIFLVYHHNGNMYIRVDNNFKTNIYDE